MPTLPNGSTCGIASSGISPARFGLNAAQALRGIDRYGGAAGTMRILAQRAHIFGRRHVFVAWRIVRPPACVEAAHERRGIRIDEECRRDARIVADVQ